MEKNLKKNNILFCLHYSGLNNGAVRSLVDVIEELIKNESVSAYVIYPDCRGSAIDYLEKIGAKCFYIPFYRVDYNDKTVNLKKKIRNTFAYNLKGIFSYYNFYKARRMISKYNITTIYSNTIVIDYGFVLSKKMGIPHLWHVREFGKEDHGLNLRGGERKLYANLENSQGIIYISKAIEGKYRPNIKKDVPQYVIYNDISTDFINPKKNFNMCNTEPLQVAIIGTIQKGKGQLDVIQAVAEVNKMKLKCVLHIAGKEEGSYYEEIKAYVKKHALQNMILFDGFIEEVNKYRSKMDVGVVASENEAFGRVTIEGMLSELAIIGADAAGTLELIQDGVNGLLYHKGDIEQLAKMLNLFYDDRQYMKKIAQTGYKKAIENYTTHQAAKKISEILYKI